MLTKKEALKHAESSRRGIEAKLDLCKVPEHEKREILQMATAYGDYLSQAIAALVCEETGAI